MTKGRMKKVLLAIGVVLLLALVVFASLRGRGETGEKVTVEEAERRDLVQVVKASGEVNPRVQVNLSAPLAGEIEALYVREGDTVEAGQPVLQLDQEALRAVRDDWQARLMQARSDVRRAEVELADAQLGLRRQRQLAEEGIISAEALEAAELRATATRLDLERARQTVAQAQANFAKAQDDLGKTTVHAPISGRVIALNAEAGENVFPATMNNPASVIGIIADLSEILAEVEVDETEVVRVDVGQAAELESDAVADRIYQGRVVEIGSSGVARSDQPDVTAFTVKILFLDPDEALRPGMSVRAAITTARREEALVLPIQAVVEREIEPRPEGEDGAPAVAGSGGEEVPVAFVVVDGKAVRRQVETGISDETHVEVLSGVEPGDPVIVGPYRTLRELEDGDPVRIDTSTSSRRDDRDAGDDEADGGAPPDEDEN